MSSAAQEAARITMVKKRLASGEACRKCDQTEAMLRARGLWERIDEVVWADEADPASPGMILAARHRVEAAPFFLVDGGGGAPAVYTSALELIRARLGPPATATDAAAGFDVAGAAAALADRHPLEVVRHALERFGADLAIACSGAEDVVLVDLAAESGLPFTVVSIDTGRLPHETHEVLERLRARYGCAIHVASPATAAVEALVEEKGLFSFFQDGHEECCAIRKVEPLRRALGRYRAWMTGQRRDQAATRGALALVEIDPVFRGAGDAPLVKWNPLVGWTLDDVWRRIHARGVPYNALHARGYASIGCAPCTRAILPGQRERDGRWWWEDALKKECGLHAGNLRRG